MQLALLPQMVFVFGTLVFRGTLLLTNPHASARRSWLYLLVGALSVETDGVILFEVGQHSLGGARVPYSSRVEALERRARAANAAWLKKSLFRSDQHAVLVLCRTSGYTGSVLSA